MLVQTGSHGAQEVPWRPNIVFVLTDDLDARSIEHMPKLRSLLIDRGTTFENAFVTNSLCCPSRATILRGQYTHNHRILSNLAPDGGFERFRSLGHENSTVATWLQDAGYRTVLIGKYFNEYKAGTRYIPPGWDEWYGLSGTKYYDYTINENGQVVRYGDGEDDYQTDLLGSKATEYIERTANDERPFFMYLAPYAPHTPATPAPRHENAFADIAAPRLPSFNEEKLSDKPKWVRQTPRLNAQRIDRIDSTYRDRLRSMLAVEDMVEDLVGALRESGKLNNTYIVFTSDNGHSFGEHRRVGKRTAYEEEIHVPLIVRGPGVPAGRTLPHMILNNDFASTFAELGGAVVPSFVDGRSLVPLLGADPPPAEDWRSAFLVESALKYEGQPPYMALRTGKYLYAKYANGEEELYNLSADPYELENQYATADSQLLAELQGRLSALQDCTQTDCRAAEGGSPPAKPNDLSLVRSSAGITLVWADNSEADLAGYNVYRAKSEDGRFAKLNVAPLIASIHNDTKNPGRPSYYRVTAVDGAGNESDPAVSESTRRNDLRIKHRRGPRSADQRLGERSSSSIRQDRLPKQGRERMRGHRPFRRDRG